MGGSRAVSSLTDSSSPLRSVGRCALRACSPVSRGISKNQYTRARRRERRGCEAKKKFDIRSSGLLLFLSPLFPSDMSIIFTFRFSFFPLYSLAEVNHAHSASLSLSLIIPDVANRRRRVRGGEGKGETDRFQGRGLASEEVRREIVRGGHRKGGWREARESLFSQKRAARAFGVESLYLLSLSVE